MVSMLSRHANFFDTDVTKEEGAQLHDIGHEPHLHVDGDDDMVFFGVGFGFVVVNDFFGLSYLGTRDAMSVSPRYMTFTLIISPTRLFSVRWNRPVLSSDSSNLSISEICNAGLSRKGQYLGSCDKISVHWRSR